MEITVLGSGTSGGVPEIGCECQVCQSTNKKDKRLRSSVLIKNNGNTVVIDVGPDFRTQILNAAEKSIDAVFLTHQHRDHTSGLDDLRYFSNKTQMPVPVYARKHVLEDVVNQFPYAFGENAYRGGPRMDLRQIDGDQFLWNGQTVQVINAVHGAISVVGYRFDNFAYLTDLNQIQNNELEKLKGLDLLILGALRKTPHVSHLSLEQALSIIDKVKPKRTALTHISHMMGKHDEMNMELPSNVEICYDGQIIKLQ